MSTVLAAITTTRWIPVAYALIPLPLVSRSVGLEVGMSAWNVWAPAAHRLPPASQRGPPPVATRRTVVSHRRPPLQHVRSISSRVVHRPASFRTTQHHPLQPSNRTAEPSTTANYHRLAPDTQPHVSSLPPTLPATIGARCGAFKTLLSDNTKSALSHWF